MDPRMKKNIVIASSIAMTAAFVGWAYQHYYLPPTLPRKKAKRIKPVEKESKETDS